MKSRIILTATAMIVCLAVFLCACGKGADDASTTEADVQSPWSEAEVFTVPDEPQTQAPDSGSAPADADADTDAVMRRIEAARAVYGLFSQTRPQLDKSDSVEIEEDIVGYRVVDPKFDTMDKLVAYVSGFFSDDIVQRLFNIGIYAQVDGKLYAVDAGVQAARTSDPVVEVTQRSDTAEHYRLTVRKDTDGDGEPDAERTYEYIYEKQSDGKWVFTRFEGF